MLKSESGVWLINFGKFINFIKVCNMNYLAHACLSFGKPDILLGNMINDFIKGKKQFDYPAAIQKGIRLHRAIDQFTDTHEATRHLKSFFRPQYRLYSGAFADVIYDHYLANDSTEFASESALKVFTGNTYQVLEANLSMLPLPFQKMFPYMKEQDWLYNYRYTWGIQKSFGGLVRRAAYLQESEIAFELFYRHYNEMRLCYTAFYPDLKKFTALQLELLLNG